MKNRGCIVKSPCIVDLYSKTSKKWIRISTSTIKEAGQVLHGNDSNFRVKNINQNIYITSLEFRNPEFIMCPKRKRFRNSLLDAIMRLS